MPLIRLIYSSDARETLVYRDFMEIMTKAGEVNASLEITGMLCYGTGKFLRRPLRRHQRRAKGNPHQNGDQRGRWHQCPGR